jgi:hypothetical protein
MQISMYEEKNLRNETKVSIYKAVVLINLLYDSETWVTPPSLLPTSTT